MDFPYENVTFKYFLITLVQLVKIRKMVCRKDCYRLKLFLSGLHSFETYTDMDQRCFSIIKTAFEHDLIKTLYAYINSELLIDNCKYDDETFCFFAVTPYATK